MAKRVSVSSRVSTGVSPAPNGPKRNPPRTGGTKDAAFDARANQVLHYVLNAGLRTSNWMEIFNAVFSEGGKVDEQFRSESERIAFSKSPQHKKIFKLLSDIRTQHGDASEEEMAKTNASGVFNLRLPKALHAALVQEAEEQGVSLNQLCLAKLAVQLRRAVKTS
jgi:predicted HicB family RNase H-like nuclease